MDLVLTRHINPGKVFDLQVEVKHVAEGYKAMDQRRAINTLLRVSSLPSKLFLSVGRRRGRNVFGVDRPQ